MAIDEAKIRTIFRISLWLKAAHSLLEILGGLTLAFVSHQALLDLANALTRAELVEDPHDVVANLVQHSALGFTEGAQSFAAWYLASHGAIKLVLVAGVLADRIWAYPAFIVAMLGFIAYQGYKLGHHVSLPMVAITILDVIVLVLAWHEYGFIRKQHAHAEEASP